MEEKEREKKKSKTTKLIGPNWLKAINLFHCELNRPRRDSKLTKAFREQKRTMNMIMNDMASSYLPECQ